MKKKIFYSSLGAVVLVGIIVGYLIVSGKMPLPIKNFDSSDFEVIYTNERIKFLERDFTEDGWFTMPGYTIESEGDVCTYSSEQIYYYVVEKNGRYYDFRDAAIAGYFSCNDLYEAGILDKDE